MILVEINPNIVAIWKLIQKNYKLEQRLPKEIKPGAKVSEMKVDEEVRNFLRYKTVKYHSYPLETFTLWASWDWPNCRRKIIEGAEKIAHWKIICGSFESLKVGAATWFVDPPYAAALAKSVGHYEFERIDYGLLGACCLFRWRGQIIVCEQDGASWLPFRELHRKLNPLSSKIVRPEMIYSRED